MGRTNDVNAVVDTKARVIGVKNLRVIDASAFPFLPPGHPMSTVCESAYISFCLPLMEPNLYITSFCLLLFCGCASLKPFAANPIILA